MNRIFKTIKEFKERFILPFSIFLLTIILFLFNMQDVSALEGKESELIIKIAKDYSNKFCNSVSFGLSEKSAKEFALKESTLIFEKRKGFQSINKEEISNEINKYVLDKCGYSLDLQGIS